MELFYCADIHGSQATLNEQESLHCVRVLRHKAGDELMFTDGAGNKHYGVIEIANARSCILNIEKTITEPKRDFYLHIAIAVPKAIDRFEWFLEKATELGVEEITPLLCRYSERKHINIQRSEKILVSAMKQSNRLHLPGLNDLSTFSAFIDCNFEGVKSIAHCEATEKKSLKEILPATRRILVLIGPEGDFSSEEIKKAMASGFSAVSLGEKRLRTETAAIHVCSSVKYWLND